MKLAFVANGDKCQFFNLIGKSITRKRNDITILWICISKDQYNFLLEQGYRKENILLINWDIRNGEGHVIGDYKLNELAWADRQLKNHFEEGIIYLKRMQSLFHDFIFDNSIQLIFGEMTWAHEILMSRICSDKFIEKCHYLHPQSIRIPNGRFTMMDTEFQDTIFPIAEFIHPESELENYKIPIKPVVPQRVADVAADVQSTLTWKYKLNRIIGFLILNRFEKEVNYSDSLNNLGLSPWKRRRRVWKNEMNKHYYTKILKKISINELKDRKFFFITLHMQPEASVDVVGRYYEDQFEIIKNVWRILPNDYYLVVKEHTNAIGNRGKEFFKKCLSLKNVLLVDEWESSHEILKKAETVFSNSGTIALEAALYGKDVFLFSKIFFDKLSRCHKISLEDLKYSENYFKLLNSCRNRDKNNLSIDDYSKYIIRSSFSGVIDPHKGSSYYTDRMNIDRISDGFITFLKYFK